MKQGMTIQEASAEILRQSQAKADYLVNTENLHMETCDGVPVLRLLGEDGIDRVEPLDILPTAHRQITGTTPDRRFTSFPSVCVFPESRSR